MDNQLNVLNEKEKLELALKYVPEDQPSPRAYIELVKTQIMGTDRRGNQRPFEDLVYFLNVSRKAGLDPSLKQIYAVYRWNSRVGREVMSIQTGIDGLRAIAERTGLYGGSDDGVFEGVIEKKGGHPSKATVTVYKLNPKTGERMPVTASARWEEYAVFKKDGSPEGMWARMPHTMLEKCAEAKALRKAFPMETSQLYVNEEMQQFQKIELPTPKKFEKKEEEMAPEKIDQAMKEAKSIADKLLEENESNN